MIIVEKETIVTIPTLHVVKAALKDQSSIPTVFFLHGFTSAKEHNLHVAYLMAEQGFRVILPDAIHHGEREDDLSKDERKLAMSFWEIVLTSIKELDLIKKTLTEKGLVDEERIGVIGTSMGAITTYGALTQFSWIQSAVSLMGVAHFQSFAEAQIKMMEQKGVTIDEAMKEMVLAKLKPFDLSKQLDKIDNRPLLIWHGKQDQVVPYLFSEQIHQSLLGYYDEQPENLRFISEEQASHKVSRQAILKSVDWFTHHLLKKTFKVS
ncbi:esterase [Alkalihalobacillus alcalophilus ATCC 27647 = CGMCC 1.3604]|uniref:Esterase n=1 Tax=Alkalihalobacillus alcalophilus ATCC 27647 = CGMCC 1.3604 TaxID=1218173 RepID=A0A094XF26_ALKAL|nr:esterase [Alkalihalobacillus alcalophilus]KGA97365.1 esterase [Alkalihalobacillus alcalophilus ATCC 27647 = CGMCC 1.3604]MED1562093.1 esterase [Alkalihalobacillus alcalophilus]THG88365.1 esterase [Alkalihalobacillus alcalophilus ATCC 27647 = CGMCC 1.3604]